MMNNNKTMVWIAIAAVGVGMLGQTHAAVREITLRDYTGRGFAPDLVTYDYDGKDSARLRLTGPDGKPVAIQAGKGTLSFIAELPADTNVTYTLRDDGQGERGTSAVQVMKDGDTVVLANGLLAVKAPAVQEKTFKEPVAANTLPAPILGFRGADGAWRGGGKVLATRPVKAFRVTLAASGPVFCEIKYELEFAVGGYYRATIRVEDLVPLVKIDEEYDPGVMDGTDAWELDLVKGWQPDRMEVARTCGNGSADAGHVDPLDKLKEKPSWYLVPDSAWGAPLSQLGLFAEAAQKANPSNYPMAGIVPLHKGDWRNMNALEIQSTGPADVRVRFPMSRRYASWLREVTSETSPFSMQEHEPGLPLTYSRRHWGLVLAPPAMTCKGESGNAIGPFYQARMFYGSVGLDRYKDFVLAWPDAKTAYPRLYLKTKEVESYKKALATAPLSDVFKQKLLDGWYILSGDPKVAQKKADWLRKNLAYLNNFPFASPTIGHHATAANYISAAAADDVLAWPELSPDLRQELRARLALVCYLWEDADVISYADGSHPGNPNMGTARSASMAAFMALLPDHPMNGKWRAHMGAYLTYKAVTQTAPGGGYFEYGSAYHMHGFSRVMNILPALQATGVASEHLLDADRQNWSYYMNLITPVDSRWKYRVIPGLANSPAGYTENLLEAAGELAPRDPGLAANLLWAWLANGANDRNDPIYGMNGILAPVALKPQEPVLKSEIYPGVGVIFRAHQGPDETYMFLRAGNNWSHWTEDQGHMIMMSRGATLLPFQPYQYFSVGNKDYEDKNVLRFGHPENKMPHAWPDANILDHAFGPTVDYAWSSVGYPDWYIQPGAVPEFGGKVDAPVGSGGTRKLAAGIEQKQGAFDWNRQVLFMKGKTAKSPNYFVVRDSAPGAGKLASWFFLNLLGSKEVVKTDGGNLLVDTEWPVKLDVRFPQLSTIKPEFYEERQFVSLGSYSGPSWWRKEGPLSKNWVTKDGAPLQADAKGDFWEKHTMLRLQGAPGEGYFWLLYPRTADEPAPKATTPAPGVMKIEHPDGTDYTFLSSTSFTYEAEGVVFAGCAGTVRVAKDGSVTLALTGGRGKVGYKGTIVNGKAPLEKTFKPGELKPGEQGGAGAMEQGQVTVLEGGKEIRFVAPEGVYVRLNEGNVGVRGVGPFDLTFTADKITGTVEGATRTIVTTWPEKIVRPMFHMDGNRWYAGWADDHSIVKGTATPQFGFAFGVTAGKHTVEVSEWTYPALPPMPIRRNLMN